MPTTAAQLRAVARWVRSHADRFRKSTPTLLGPTVNELEEQARLDDLLATKLLRLAQWDRQEVRLDRCEVERLRRICAPLLPHDRGLMGRASVDFGAACARALTARRGAPRLTPTLIAQRLRDGSGDERELRRLRRRAKYEAALQAWRDDLAVKGESLLTASSPPPKAPPT